MTCEVNTQSNKWLTEAQKDLDCLIGKLAYKDYYTTNYRNGKRRSKKHIQYNLSKETNEAREIYHLVYGKKEVTREVEEQVKAFLLPYRSGRMEIKLQ